MTTPITAKDEFLRVFGPPAHTAPAETEGSFEGWCDGWDEHAVYRADVAARTLSHFEEGFGEREDGEQVVCAALEADGALLRLLH